MGGAEQGRGREVTQWRMGEAEQGEADQKCSGEWEKQSRERKIRNAVENGRSRAGRGRLGMQWRMGEGEQGEEDQESSGEWEKQSRGEAEK